MPPGHTDELADEFTDELADDFKEKLKETLEAKTKQMIAQYLATIGATPAPVPIASPRFEVPAKVPKRRPPSSKPDINEQIRMALLHDVMDNAELAKRLDIDESRVAECTKELEREGMLYNLEPNPDHPWWIWRVGDDTSTAVLKQTVQLMIEFTPLRIKDMSRITRAREPRVGGAVSDLQRARIPGWQVLNVDKGRRGMRYFILNPNKVEDASMEPKIVNGRPVVHGNRRADVSELVKPPPRQRRRKPQT